MNLDDIKLEYGYFLEHIGYAHSYLEELVRETNNFLLKYSKSKHCDKNFAERIEVNLLYLENMLSSAEKIMDYIEIADVEKLELPKTENVIKMDDYIIIPDDYDEFVYAVMDNPINLVELPLTLDFYR